MCIGFDLTISLTQYFNLCSSSLPDFKSILNCSAAKLGNELERSTSRGTQRFQKVHYCIPNESRDACPSSILYPSVTAIGFKGQRNNNRGGGRRPGFEANS